MSFRRGGRWGRRLDDRRIRFRLVVVVGLLLRLVVVDHVDSLGIGSSKFPSSSLPLAATSHRRIAFLIRWFGGYETNSPGTCIIISPSGEKADPVKKNQSRGGKGSNSYNTGSVVSKTYGSVKVSFDEPLNPAELSHTWRYVRSYSERRSLDMPTPCLPD